MKPDHLSDAKCRLCGSGRTSSLGAPAYRKPPRVAGVEIFVEDLNIELFRCLDCGYRFISPPVPEDRLAACYQASASHWDTSESVASLRSYSHKRDLISRYMPTARRMLNVGCYDGGFEQAVPKDLECFGVEPSSAASEVAAMRGVTMLGSSIDDIDGSNDKFDAIVLFDVAEHIIEPLRSFVTMKDMLSPGGIIMFETGNMDAFPWQEKITLNPYCAIYEHVGFFNESSVERLADLLRLDLVYFEESVHMKIPSRMLRFKRWIKIQLYWIIRRLRLIGVPMPAKLDRIASGPVPVPPVQRDHLIAILKDKAP